MDAVDPRILEAIKLLASQGINLGDFNKALKEAKAEGIIKGGRVGKSPESDATRLGVIAALLGAKVTIKTDDGTEVVRPLMEAVAEATGELTSFMVTLNDDWKINFVKNIKREKKVKGKDAVAPATNKDATGVEEATIS